MDPRRTGYRELIDRVRARIRTRRILRGTAITIAVTAVSIIAVSAAAYYYGHRPGILIALRILPVAPILAAAWFFLIRPLTRQISDAQVALLIEEKGALGDRLVTAVEYSEDARAASPVIVERLVTDTNERSSIVPPKTVVDPRQGYAYAAGAALVMLLMFGLFFKGPISISGGMSKLYSPFSASASTMFISINPGTARVPRGSDQKLKAELHGFDSELAQVFIRKLDGEGWIASVMEPAKRPAEFQHMIFNIQDSVAYYIEAKGLRSPEFTLEVADLPFVKQIDLVLNFPAYTGMPSKKLEKAGEVAALLGTRVQVIAQLSMQAKAARIVLNDGTKIEMLSGGDDLFTGEFTVKENGTYKIELTSLDGEKYNGSNEFDITVLEDHPPTVVIDKPGRDMKVTSIQEVFAQARAEDDYGISTIELYYSVNGGEEKRVQLQDLKSEAARSLSGAHTFFLEEHGLQPGDFISYYAKARDNRIGGGRESTSDIYFLEVRPFDRSFRQAQQQGGGGESDGDSSALARRQRQIIAATFRVQRELSRYTPQEKDENFGAVTLSQESLKSDTDTLAERIRRRLGEQINEESDFAKLVEHLKQASKEMEAAINELKAQKTKEALSPEQRALQQLLRAEAIFRDIQIAQGQGQGGGGGNQNAEELADLFELQLDKMKNQYETIQRQQQSGQSQQQDEIARRLEELARRQQQQLEQRMRSQMQQQGGGGGGGSQRQQQEMIDEAQRMARELERLSRERRDPRMAEAAREMQRAADEMQRAQASSSSANSNEATARSLKALERMQEAQRSLDSSQRAGSQQSAQKLRQQAEEALKRQEEIARDVEQLAREEKAGGAGAATEQKKEQLAERKETLADRMEGLEKDIDQTARSLGQEGKQASDKMREAANSIRRNRIPDRIRQTGEMIENGWYDEARSREQIIRNNIEEVLKNLQAAERGANQRGQGESLEEALNNTRELADNLESLRRRSESNQNQQQGQQQGQQGQQGQQQGRQQGQQGQQGQQQGQQGQQGQQ
ncbi:MAG: hypothetical protein L0229_10730, partial [Blastocatellia bacterium]|nr:hypothetical protein [Blastocatellia bacterium]